MKIKHHVRSWVASLFALGGCADEYLDATIPAVAEQEVADTVPPEDGASLPICPARIETGYDLSSPTAKAWLKYTLSPAETTWISMRLHLDSSVPTATVPFDAAKAEQTSVYSLSTSVFDFVGGSHLLSVWFVRTGSLMWQWHALVPGDEIASAPPDRPFEGARGALQFDEAGALVNASTEYSRWTFWGTPPDAFIAFDFGQLAEQAGKQETTSLSEVSETLSVAQDGYPVGSMSGFAISESGEVTGHFSNGQARHIGGCAPEVDE